MLRNDTVHSRKVASWLVPKTQLIFWTIWWESTENWFQTVPITILPIMRKEHYVLLFLWNNVERIARSEIWTYGLYYSFGTNQPFFWVRSSVNQLQSFLFILCEKCFSNTSSLCLCIILWEPSFVETRRVPMPLLLRMNLVFVLGFSYRSFVANHSCWKWSNILISSNELVPAEYSVFLLNKPTSESINRFPLTWNCSFLGRGLN